jgi:tripartite ATP-independent transporter DctP family solute receptor
LVLLVPFLCTCSACEPTADEKLWRLKFGHVYEVRSPTHHYGTASLGERLRQAHVGLDLTVFPAAQLGNEEELLEQLVAGELDLAITGSSFLGMWHPPLSLFDAAFAFRDMDQMLEFARSGEMKEHYEVLQKKYGVRVLDTWAYGARHITSNRPIRSPADLKGFRLRFPATKTYQLSGESLGASPMPIPFSEVYLALQQGIADGQENPIPVIRAMGFHEVQKCLCLTGHIQSCVQVLINERVWQRMSDQQQQLLLVSIRQLGEEVYRGTLQEEVDLLDQWEREKTIEIIRDVDTEAFRRGAQQFFSSNFPFSGLYRSVTKAEAPNP